MSQYSRNSNLHLLFSAVDSGDICLLTTLLCSTKHSINTLDKHGDSLLHIACGYGYLEIVKYLENNGASLSIKDKQADSPLYWASRHGHINVVEWLLLQSSVSVNSKDKLGESSLHVACRYGHSKIVRVLIEHNAMINLQDNEGETCLHSAVWHGYFEIVCYLCKSGCSVNIQNSEGESPLHIASLRGYFHIVRVLTLYNSNLNSIDNDGSSPLHNACKRGHSNIVRFLCQKGTIVNITDKKGFSSLHEACKRGCLQSVSLLYIFDIKLDLVDRSGVSCLHIASKYGHFEVVKFLIISGANLFLHTFNSLTAEMLAIDRDHHKIATLLKDCSLGNRRYIFVQQLLPKLIPFKSMKLIFCGYTDVSNTDLVDILRYNDIQGALKIRTISCAIQSSTINDVALIQDILSFSNDNFGHLSYTWNIYGSFDFVPLLSSIFSTQNTVYIIVFKLVDSLESIHSQISYWLRIINSYTCFPIIHGKRNSFFPPKILFIGSHSYDFEDNDQILHISQSSRYLDTLDTLSQFKNYKNNNLGLRLFSNSSINSYPCINENYPIDNSLINMIKQCQNDFLYRFSFFENIILLDSSLPAYQTDSFKNTLISFLETINDMHKIRSGMVNVMVSMVSEWRIYYQNFPILPFNLFYDLTLERVNPLITNQELISICHDLEVTGDILLINKNFDNFLIVLDPAWICSRVFSSFKTIKSQCITYLHSHYGNCNSTEFKRVFPECNSLSISRLFEHCSLGIALIDFQNLYLFPQLLDLYLSEGFWNIEEEISNYMGVLFKLRQKNGILSHLTLNHIYFNLRKYYPSDIYEIHFYKNSIVFCHSKIYLMIELYSSMDSLSLCSRSSACLKEKSFYLFRSFYIIISNLFNEYQPNLKFITLVFSVQDLKAHIRNPLCYFPNDIFNALRFQTDIKHPISGTTERLVDLLCCGIEQMTIMLNCTPLIKFQDIPITYRKNIYSELDVGDNLGRDWSVFAITIGLSGVVPIADIQLYCSSKSEFIIRKWEMFKGSNVSSLYDTLIFLELWDIALYLLTNCFLFFIFNYECLYKVFLDRTLVKV